MKAVPKAGGNIIYKMLEVVYSPITSREEQVRLTRGQVIVRSVNLILPQAQALQKTGWLKKQGLKNKNWKRRWFVLDHEKLQYWEDEKCKKVLGTMYLDELQDVLPNKAMCTKGPSL